MPADVEAPFVPQRHPVQAADAAPGMQTLGDAALNVLECLANELLLETSSRRAMASALCGLSRCDTPHVAEHLAWLMAMEPDALTALSLYRAVLATHPMDWTIHGWRDEVLKTTPFPLVRLVLLAELMEAGDINLDSEADRSRLALLDRHDPEHRALQAEHRWLVGGPSKVDGRELVAMLQPAASMPEKLAALRVVYFGGDPDLDARVLPALKALFRVERHPGLSLRIAEVITRRNAQRVDLDLLAFLIRARLGDGIQAAERAMRSVLYGVESFLLDSFAFGEERGSQLAASLLARHGGTRLPEDASSVALALQAISVDMASPLAAFAATAALQAAHQPHAEGAQCVQDAARGSQDPVARALAIRVLGTKPRALLPLLDEIKALTVARDTPPEVRRAAFHALVNRRQSALPTRMPEVIDLWFQYLREAPFAHFADALGSSDVAPHAVHYLQRFSASLDAIGSEAARVAAFRQVEMPFGFGIAPEFEAHWSRVVALMLRALEKPRHGELHYLIFWNLLHEVPIPAPAAGVFAAGLKELLARVKYPKRSRQLISGWLEDYQDAGEPGVG